MVDADTLALFLPAALALVLAPGPAVGFILATTLRHGRRAGLAATLGIEGGNTVHVLAAALGLSAVLATSATAFTVVKAAGAAWLLWLAVRAWRARTPGTLADLGTGPAGPTDGADGAHGTDAAGPTASGVAGTHVPGARTPAAAPRFGAMVRAGLLVGTLNPKTALFFLAFLPQFVRPDAGPAWAQMLTLGFVFVGLACALDGLWAVGGDRLRTLFPRLRMRVLDRVSAAVYATLGALTLAARRLA
ncbi:LysE family translocator [Actinotalea subterranea]|uniref:LysE family translocator n=1 Tax=Actinotalea subterranea TaxID=2607497 RepID=UPI0011EE8232|nr:LysE family translocator [Actinotalea subterranea]